MANDWEEVSLGDIVNLKRGYDLPKKLREEGGIPLISSSGVSDVHNVAKVLGPGVVTGRYGTIGEVFYTEQDFWPLNTTLYACDFKKNHPKFIYYLLKTISYSDYSDKAAVPGINRNHLHMAKVRVPKTLAEQKAIAHILGSLDDKIELNRQMNQTLEAMAQALFKSWFVDFDPVIDNTLAAGKPIPDELSERAEQRKAVQQGDNQAVRALFPDEFVLTEEMGWIPKGWQVEELEKRIDVLNGFAFKSQDYVESGIFVLRTKNFNSQQVVELLTDDVYLPLDFKIFFQVLM
jgi:type I restriction enzyme S subunit